MWCTEKEGFPVYRTIDVPLQSTSLGSLQQDEVDIGVGQTRFKQGELGNCWLAAAIESLQNKNNRRALEEVVFVNDNELEFRFWHKGSYQRTVILASDEVPIAEDGNLIFLRNVDGTEIWGMLLEKAYAKWVGSYESLNGGFWADAMQSFTGGVIERIKILQEDDSVTESLFDIMRNAWSNGSTLCCIKKTPGNRETYHACCIIAVRENGDNRSVDVYDQSTQEYDGWTFDEFTKNYYRLDMCHTNWDNLSLFQGRNISPSPWKSQFFPLKLNNGCDEFDITLARTDDDQEDCILAIELIQCIKPDEGEKLSDVRPWDAVIPLVVEVNDEEPFIIRVPQDACCYILQPGNHHIKVSSQENKHRDIYVRLLTKSCCRVQRNQED